MYQGSSTKLFHWFIVIKKSENKASLRYDANCFILFFMTIHKKSQLHLRMSLMEVTSARWQNRKPQVFLPSSETPVQQYPSQFPLWELRNQLRGSCTPGATKPAASKIVGKFMTPFHHSPSSQHSTTQLEENWPLKFSWGGKEDCTLHLTF